MILLNILDNHPFLAILLVIWVAIAIWYFGNKIGAHGFHSNEKVSWVKVAGPIIVFIAVALAMFFLMNEK